MLASAVIPRVALVVCMATAWLHAMAQSSTLVSIAVTPSSASVASGNTQQFTATGTYSNGTIQDLTNSVAWSSGNASVASVSSNGLLLAMLPGTATVQAATGSVSGSTNVTVLNNNLAGWWRFEEGAGNSAADASGNNNPASLVNGVAWVGGQVQNAVSANGVNQFVSIPAANLSSTRAVTWMAWINRSWTTGAQTLLENTPNFNASTTGFGLFPGDVNDCGGPGMMMTGVHGDVGYTLNCYAEPASGAWHHLAVVYDKTQAGGSVISLYLDGILQTPTSQPYTASNTNGFESNPTYLFSRGGTAQFTSGAIDDLRIYSQALTGAQIQQVFQQGLGRLVSIAVTPANANLAVGASLRYSASGSYSSGASQDLTSSAAWTSSAPAVASITNGGLATALATGSTTIQAAVGSVSGTTTLTVTAGAALQSIAITPASFSIGVGGTQQLTATGSYTDGTQRDVSTSVTWESSNTAVATVSPAGLVTGIAAGGAGIKASYAGITGATVLSVAVSSNLIGWWQFDDGSGTAAVDSSGFAATATLFNGVSWVRGQLGTAISADGVAQYASVPSLRLNASKALTWSAWINRAYGSGKGVLLESSSNFNSSTTGFGFFPDDGPDCGLASAMMTGVHGDVGYTLSCYAQPTSGVWHHIAVVYDKSQAGANVIALYLDGVLQKPLSQPYTATNTNGLGENAIYLFSRGGSANFLAGQMDDLRIYNQALTAAQIQQTYQQGLGTLASITVTPANSSIGSGQTLQYAAAGTYTSGTTLNVTNSVTWTSSNTGIATISATGLATAGAAGTASIRATSGSITGSTNLTVTSSITLQSILVAPASVSIPANATQQLTATGYYSDGSTRDLTTLAVWNSTNTAAATVTAGLVSGVSAGTATIKATMNGITGSSLATISAASNLAAWWQMDEATGSTASDSSGFGHPASLMNGINWVKGQVGSAIAANGINQYAMVPSIDLSATRALTWMAWVNRTYGNSTAVLMEDSANFNTSTTGFGFFPDDGQDCGMTSAMMTGVHGDVGYTLNCYAQPTSGVWHHIAVVLDKTMPGTQVVSLYIDGVVQKPVSQPYIATNTNAFGNNPIYMFTRGGASNFATGQIDDVRIYNQALSAAQIQQVYQVGTGTLTSITLAPQNTSVGVGQAVQYTATGNYSNGTSQNLTGSVTWSSTAPGIASVTSAGVATGIAVGSTTIRATSGSILGATTLSITSGVTLKQLTIVPASFSIPPAGTEQLIATGTYSDGSTQNLTSSVTWSTLNSPVATVSATGLVTGVSTGTTTIQAALAGISATAQATVAASANLVGWWQFDEGAGNAAADSSGRNHPAAFANGISWVSRPGGYAVSASGTDQYATIPVIDLSTVHAITWTAWLNRTWGSGPQTLIENSENLNALTTSWGFYPDDSVDCGSPGTMMAAVHGDVGYTVNCYAQPTSGVWHHVAVIYDKSLDGPNVISLYLDGVLQPPLSQPYTATNTNNFGANTIYLFSRAGTANFTSAQMDDLRLYNRALTATQIQQIYQLGLGTLTSITVAPSNATLRIGAQQQYAALGNYSGGASVDLSASVTWSSSNTATATINASGQATAVALGTTNIQAKSGAITASTQLTVSAAPVLQTITIAPGGHSIPAGTTQQMSATGQYSDGSTQDLTSAATWSSSNVSVATISSAGLLTALSAGSTTIQAKQGSVTGQTTVTVASSAVQFVQWASGDAGAVSSETTYQYGNATSGNLILVLAHWDNQAVTATASDQLGNVYVPVSAPVNSGPSARFQVWYAKNINGGIPLAVTLTFSGRTASFSVVDVIEYAGLDTTAPLDVSAWAAGYGTAQNSGNMPVTTSADETIIGLFGYSGYLGPYMAGPGFTFRNYDASTMAEDRAVAATGVYSATATSTSPAYWAAFALGMRNKKP